MSHFNRDASGRVISLLQDTVEPQRSYSYSANTNSYAYPSHMGNTSYPTTPDLMRSDSYDSQASNTDPASPLTPNSAYPESFFSTAKQSHSVSSHSRKGSGEAPMYQLPPISTIHKVANPMELKSAPSPRELFRRSSSGQFAPGMSHRTSSSSLEDYHYHHSIDTRATHLRPVALSRTGSAVQHSVEQQSDDYSHSQPSAEKRKAAPQDDADDDEEMLDAGSKKSSKSKNGVQRRYPCKFRDICEKTFTTSGHASRHAKIHGGEKTIECSYEGCTKRFTRADNMKQHLETHKKDKSRRPDKLARGPSHALMRRRQSASSRGSVSRYSTPRDSPPILSPTVTATAPLMSPGLPTDGWSLSARPSVPSRTPSGLDALAMVAATEQATVEHEESQRYADHETARLQYYSQLQQRSMA